MFEVKPKEGHEQHYFDRAAALRPRLAKNDGILFIDRYKSLSRIGIILSHSHWRDEASMTRWRIDEAHHKTQAAGRNVHFEDYRIRISHVLHHSIGAKSAKTWTGDGAYRDLIAEAEGRQPVASVLLSIVSRDYGMHDRNEAPQYFPPVRP